MEEEWINFVEHDGKPHHINDLKDMAMNAGSYNVAEHYIVSILFHATIYHLPQFHKYVNEIRRHYNLEPFPTSKEPASNNNMPQFAALPKKPADIAREIYRKMTKEQRKAVLKDAMIHLKHDCMELFKNKSCWIGIYLVVKDRLDENINQSNFYDLGVAITPDGWPQNKAIGKTTMSNLTRNIKDVKDRQEAYYDMTDNPFEELCDRFWNILLSLILTKKKGNI